jgi:hypothetical protein
MTPEFEDITQSDNVVKSAKLAIGESFQGTLKALEENGVYDGKKDLIMVGADGKEFTVWSSGSLNYAIQEDKFEVGRTYRITRLENKASKNGARTMFKIERLKEDGSVAAPKTNATAPKGKSL